MRIPDNMNTAQIRRLDDSEHFTVDPRPVLSSLDRSICDLCAVKSCRIRAYHARTNSKGCTQSKVSTCADFLPALGFSVLHGLDYRFWNTVRVGGAWADRLKPGKEVAVIDTKNRKVVCQAVVKNTYSNSLREILRDHAIHNHAIQAEINDGKIEPGQAVDRLLRILKNAYGTNVASEDRVASAVYLERK